MNSEGRPRRPGAARARAAAGFAGADSHKGGAPPAIDPAAGARAALLLGVMAGLLALLRVAAALQPSMHAWGLSPLRFAAPWWGWAPWALVPLAFVPAVARFVAPRLAALGDGIARGILRPRLALAVIAMALVIAFPDRLWLMGDFLLRLGCTRGQIAVEIVFPQALPLDLFLHHYVPLALAHAGLSDPNHWERALGALEAGALAFFAAAFARRLGLRGMPAAVCAGTIAFSGLLAMFTGYGKAFVELTLIMVAAATLALRVVEEGRGAWPLAVTVVVALLLHRSALALFVPLGVVAVLWWRDHGARAGSGRGATLAAFATPPLAALLLSPILIAAIRVTDRRHLAPQGGGIMAVLGAALAPLHLLDVLNLVALAAPLALVAPVLALALARPLRSRSRAALVIAALVLPALAVLLFVHPRQGLFRDTDVFAPSLAALAVAAAALAGEALRGAPSRAWLGVPVLLVTLLSTVQSLSLSADVTRGLRRVQAYLVGPPLRIAEERALLWTYTAERYVGLGMSDEAVAAFMPAAELAPSPRILTELALAEMDRDHYAGAQRAYRRAVDRAPDYINGWLGLANASIFLKDWAQVREGLAHATELEPNHPDVVALTRFVAVSAPRDTAARPAHAAAPPPSTRRSVTP